jgi:hypothetical protein
VGERRGELGDGRVEVAVELLGGVVGGEYPPLEAGAAPVADRGPAALGGAVVGDDAAARLDVGGVVEGEPAEDVQVVLALGLIARQGAADQGVDAVGADQGVALLGRPVGEVEADADLVLVEGGDLAVDLQRPPPIPPGRCVSAGRRRQVGWRPRSPSPCHGRAGDTSGRR